MTASDSVSIHSDPDKRELSVWLQNITNTSGPSGTRLWDRLEAGLVSPGSEVFALGQFLINHRPTISWYSLPVTSGNFVWVP